MKDKENIRNQDADVFELLRYASLLQRYFARRVSRQAETDLIERSFRSGVINGFMHKGDIDTHHLDAIRTIHRGGRNLSPAAEKPAGGLRA